LWWRRTDAPLRTLGLGVGLLGPASSPQTFFGAGLLGPNGGPKQTICRCDAAGTASLPPIPRRRLGRRSCLQPLCPCPRGGGRDGGVGSSSGGTRSHAGRLRASVQRIGDLDPAVGVPATGLANRHATLIEGRQRGQNRRPQPYVVAECKDALGKDKGRRTHR
jgi:hypothetical protein